MSMTKVSTAAGVAALALAAALPAAAQISDDVVKIGVLTDASGAYADVGGKYAQAIAEMAIADFGGKVKGKPVQMVYADHQNKPDVGSSIARQWYDTEKVDMITDLLSSGVAIAVQGVTKEKNKLDMITGAGSSDLTGKFCSPNGIHYVYDTYALANGTAKAMYKRGGNSWFFITADYAFGQALEKDAMAAVKAAGGTVAGAVRAPFPSSDFSSFLLQAQGSGAKVIGLANAGQDTVQAMKQANEFGITQTQSMATLLVFDSDINSMGLQTAQGLIYTTGFYWDRTEASRTFSKRFFEKTKAMPSMHTAGVYSAITTYLKAIDATGSDEPAKVTEWIRKNPINDMMMTNGKLREDGRVVYDLLLMQAKKPADSKYPWDYATVLETIPGDQAFRPLDQGDCPLVKKG